MALLEEEEIDTVLSQKWRKFKRSKPQSGDCLKESWAFSHIQLPKEKSPKEVKVETGLSHWKKILLNFCWTQQKHSKMLGKKGFN